MTIGDKRYSLILKILDKEVKAWKKKTALQLI